ncbi:MAG TPA: response regulator transcription factor [Candidatus Paceibacterota bacterium]|nr:response regulator transcription factor [Candidatus Paceibacterota bacterium]HMP19101.1 response regulator transcription factor [Candidatus Paceibacterota bacterium]HMP85105.1 response regulator transcription factor [Candidatus Paceibacterota bacterium]
MKLLIIEDDISIRNVLRLGLEELSYSVDEAEDGERGLYLAKINKYDLIILDNILPKKLGKKVCEEIRNSGINTPILLLSAKNDVNSKIELLDSGADDYLTKPFSFAELQARIKSLLRRPHKIEGIILKSKNIILNTDTGEVFFKNKKIYLTRKEFCLLEFLMKNSNKILNRTKLIENIWDMNGDPFSNTIETHISNLRGKIKDSNKKIILNVPGRGYKFVSD